MRHFRLKLRYILSLHTGNGRMPATRFPKMLYYKQPPVAFNEPELVKLMSPISRVEPMPDTVMTPLAEFVRLSLGLIFSVLPFATVMCSVGEIIGIDSQTAARLPPTTLILPLLTMPSPV